MLGSRSNISFNQAILICAHSRLLQFARKNLWDFFNTQLIYSAHQIIKQYFCHKNLSVKAYCNTKYQKKTEPANIMAVKLVHIQLNLKYDIKQNNIFSFLNNIWNF